MKYFTKYIPVEEQLKKGDWYMRSDNTVDNNFAYVTMDSFKVKLFLCSRDIQAGDMVCDNNDMSLFVKVEDANEYRIHAIIDGKKMILYPSEVLKVIGEVSPNAIWVKEGMEFEEDEVRSTRFYNHKYNSTTECSEDYKEKPRTDLPWTTHHVTSFFKCPTCNTFH